MKITFAVWEIRNLGIEVYEVDCEATDANDVLSRINELKADMVVCRLDVGRAANLFEFARQGFVNVETIFSLRRSSRSPGDWRPRSSIQSQVLSGDERSEVLDLVKSGVFEFDRVSIDPRFSTLIAGHRMANWLQDEISSGGEIVGVFRGAALFAFFSFRKTAAMEAHIALSAVIPTRGFPGAGQLLQAAIIDKFAANNVPWINTKVSSNNLPALRSNLAVGFEIVRAEHILVRHQ